MAYSTRSAWKKISKKPDVKPSPLALVALLKPIVCSHSIENVRRSSTLGVGFPFKKDYPCILLIFQIFWTSPNRYNYFSFSSSFTTFNRPFPYLPVFSSQF
jgi:hypothetical protein